MFLSSILLPLVYLGIAGNVIFINAFYDARFPVKDLAEKNRIVVPIITDGSMAHNYFKSDQEAAFKYLVTYFHTVNQAILKEKFVFKDSEGVIHKYTDYGFSLRKIVLNHQAFSTPFLHNNQTHRFQMTMNSLPEYQEKMLSDFLTINPPTEVSHYGLVMFFTAKKIVNFNGYNLGRVCVVPNNIIVVSFHNCLNVKNALNESSCIKTFLHECYHALGAQHTDKTVNDVMLENGEPQNMNLSNDTRKSVAVGIYTTVFGCFQKEEEVSTKKIFLVDSFGEKRVLRYQEMLESSLKFVDNQIVLAKQKAEIRFKVPTSSTHWYIIFVILSIGLVLVIAGLFSYYFCVQQRSSETEHINNNAVNLEM